jgi:hypothetical protein
VVPAIQAVHPVFAVTVQVLLLRVPAAQTVQAVHVAAFVVVLKVDPATQAVHPVFAVTVHVLLLRVPAAQTVHAVHATALVVVL